MTPEDVIALIVGPAGVLVVLSLLVTALVRGLLVPNAVLAKSEERVSLLEQENAGQNRDMVNLVNINAGLKAEVASLRKELEYLKQEVHDFRRER